MTETELPSDLQAFSAFLDAQPTASRDLFNYCICLMMIEAGKMSLVEELAADINGP
jgi:hypothetical protein